MRNLRRIIVIVSASVWLTGVARADYASAPITGAAIVTNAQFINVYLFPDPGRESWDQHLVSLHKAGADQFPFETTEAIDQFTVDLTQSSYFDVLLEYGIHSPVMGASQQAVQSCVDAALKDVMPGNVLSYGTLRTFASCQQKATGSKATQVNLIVSPDIDVAGFSTNHDLLGGGPVPGDCGTHNGTSGFHGFGLNVQNFTVNPTHAGCNRTMGSLTQTISHEMVETMSDPAGLGYIHETAIGRFGGNVTDEYNKGELGDICESQGLMNPKGDLSVSFLPFGDSGFSVSKYWSNINSSCQPSGIMTRAFLNQAGSPLIRFTGSVHTFQTGITVASGDANRPVRQLEAIIGTGSDDLRAGSGPNDNANMIINLKHGPIQFNNVNESQNWGNNTQHIVVLPMPPGVMAGDLQSVMVTTSFGGGLGGDNWNMNSIGLKGEVPETGAVAIATSGGMFVTAVNGGGIAGSGSTAIDTKITVPGAWETFTIHWVDKSKGLFNLLTNDSHFVTAVNGGGIGSQSDPRNALPLHTDATKASDWETFNMVFTPTGEVNLMTHDGTHMLSAINGGGIGESQNAQPIHTDATQAQGWEMFNLKVLTP